MADRRLAESKIGKKFRCTIPKAVRDILKLNEGDVIGWYLDRGLITIAKMKSEYDEEGDDD